MGHACPRCRGLVTNDELGIDLNGQTLYAELLRCINCGERFDPVMERNRLVPPLPDKEPDRIRRKPRQPVLRVNENNQGGES